MTITKTIQLLRTGRTPIDVEPRWGGNGIVCFIMYVESKWVDALLTLKECELRADKYWREDDLYR